MMTGDLIPIFLPKNLLTVTTKQSRGSTNQNNENLDAQPLTTGQEGDTRIAIKKKNAIKKLEALTEKARKRKTEREIIVKKHKEKAILKHLTKEETHRQKRTLRGTRDILTKLSQDQRYKEWCRIRMQRSY